MCEQEAWQLHLAFQEAASETHFYAPTTEAVADIREYTEVNEGELALQVILAIATPEVPAELRERAYQVAIQSGATDFTAAQMKAWVDGWLEWRPGSETDPPYLT